MFTHIPGYPHAGYYTENEIQTFAKRFLTLHVTVDNERCLFCEETWIPKRGCSTRRWAIGHKN